MDFLRKHWQDLGAVLALIGTGLLAVFGKQLDDLSLLLWISLISLFIHQFEEYRYPGYFPGMVNSVLFGSKQPDRYPLNTNTSVIVNLAVGWVGYLLAALLGPKAIWLAMATILVSGGNFVAHTFLFNIKGKTLYNPGLITSVLFFLPIVIAFFHLVTSRHLATTLDWVVGIPLGMVMNYVGIMKTIDWLKDENTSYIFPQRCLLPKDRK